jgi:hypothetical protein
MAEHVGRHYRDSVGRSVSMVTGSAVHMVMGCWPIQNKGGMAL